MDTNLVQQAIDSSNRALTKRELELLTGLASKKISEITEEEIKRGRLYADNILKTYGRLQPKELENVRRFEDIKNCRQMQAYLSDISFIKRGEYISHYTKVNVAKAIFEGGYWYMNSPKSMNDGLELTQGSSEAWDHLFFASFMFGQKESIGMWSMYAQPWSEGVMLSIPGNIFKKWVNDIDGVYEADPVTKHVIKEHYVDLRKAKISATRVAYKEQTEKNENKLNLINTHNENIKGSLFPDLVGYIKDDAWSYERELRLRVDLDASIDYSAIAVKVPEYVLESIEITKGPRCKISNNELSSISQSRIHDSLFSGKLNWVYCDSCNQEM